MIVLAILATIAAGLWTLLVFFANANNPTGGSNPQGCGTVVVAWGAAAVLWIAWAVDNFAAYW